MRQRSFVNCSWQDSPATNFNTCLGGDDGVRTRDLVVANHALSQLSYIPQLLRRLMPTGSPHLHVGVLGFEPRTSALSELRSSQLSYTPAPGAYAARLATANKKAKPIRVWPYPQKRAGDRA